MLSDAYVAGIVDGEGHIGFNLTHGKWLSPRLAVSMTCLELIKILHDQFGGTFTVAKKSKSYHSQCYTWSARSGSVATILEKLLPYLIVKNKQARLIMQFESLGNHTDETVNFAFKTLMHKYNQRGSK